MKLTYSPLAGIRLHDHPGLLSPGDVWHCWPFVPARAVGYGVVRLAQREGRCLRIHACARAVDVVDDDRAERRGALRRRRDHAVARAIADVGERVGRVVIVASVRCASFEHRQQPAIRHRLDHIDDGCAELAQRREHALALCGLRRCSKPRAQPPGRPPAGRSAARRPPARRARWR